MSPAATGSTIKDWNGSSVTLAPGQSVTMPLTPNGSTVLAWQNLGRKAGQLILTSGGAGPVPLSVPVSGQPGFYVANWEGNNLTLTNTGGVPILIEMAGPGIPGMTPVPLVVGVPLSLPSGNVSEGAARKAPLQLAMKNTSGSQ